MRPLILLGLLVFGACCKCPPPPPDMRPTDLAAPADLAVMPDLAAAPDLSSPPDLSVCVPRFKYCNRPGEICCPGLTCVGGACALVPVK